MDILVVDRDKLSTQLIRSKLEPLGHRIVEEDIKNNAMARLEKEKFDVVMIDPAPLNDGRSLVLSARRASKDYSYIILMAPDLDPEHAAKTGANAFLAKPMDSLQLEEMMGNAKRLLERIKQLGDESEDFPSAGGVIAKSAFNQLFLSALDRADRYAEKTYLLFVNIDNRDDIMANEGPYGVEYATAKLSQYMVRLRRQSDIIAQTGKSEYCLLLQRPQYAEEPMEASKRYAEAMQRLEDIRANDDSYIEVAVRLINVPVATLHDEHIIKYGHKT